MSLSIFSEIIPSIYIQRQQEMLLLWELNSFQVADFSQSPLVQCCYLIQVFSLVKRFHSIFQINRIVYRF